MYYYSFFLVTLIITFLAYYVNVNVNDKDVVFDESLHVLHKSHVIIQNNLRSEVSADLEGGSSSKTSYKTMPHTNSNNEENIQESESAVIAKASNYAKEASLKEEEDVVLGGSLSLAELSIAGQENKIIYDSLNSTHHEKVLGTDLTRSQLDLHYNATVYKAMKSNIHSVVLGSSYNKLEINLISEKNIEIYDKSKTDTGSYILGVNVTVEELNNSYIIKE